ncbi:zinc/manganese transport system ATP-binding protein [Rhodoligotrophos appendicifer]|uniref:zinc ABC transporter ATP-binding protein AztA n=1 Tax=Rhodoligotrophos appendicifer TaxID=987056 RepID=UPI0011870368|nr:zinc ABC transporter ATP-binding protein AztA [Rhodoligotrophos appendicifer]
MTGPAVELKDLTLAYRRHPAVHHLTGRFEPGSLTAIVGPNGAGKSTLLKGLIGAVPASAGRIEQIGTHRRDIAYLPQISELDRSFPITVLDLVALGTWSKTGMFRRIAGRPLEKVTDAIQAVGLTGLEGRVIGTLSGGQLQRALFARMLLQEASLLLLDEPFTAIDAKTTADLLGLIHRWHGERRTVIAVLHDMELVRENFPETLLIAREPIAWGPTATTLTPENLLAARRMGEAWDDTAALCERKVA